MNLAGVSEDSDNLDDLVVAVPGGLECGGLLRRVGPVQRTGNGCARRTELVHPPRYGRTAVGQRNRVLVLVHGVEWLVHLDELAVWQPLNNPGLDSMLEQALAWCLTA